MNNRWIKKNFKLILLFLLLIIISFLLIRFRTEKKQSSVLLKKEKIKLVNDYSKFYTVDSCIGKFINIISLKNYDNIIKVLNADYINQNNININNINNYVDNLDGKYTFSSRKMYYEEVNKNNYKYYVYGFLSKEMINGNNDYIEKYYIVNLYTKKMLFDITPYDGKIFKEKK